MSSSPSPGLRWNRGRVATLGLGALAVLLLLVALVAALAQRGEARPGTELDGVDVGGLSRTELVAVAEQVAADRRARVVTVRADDRSTEVAARDAGVRVDPEASADAALDARRGGVTGLFHGLTALLGAGHDVAPVATLRDRRLAAEVERVQDTLGDDVSDGGFRVELEDDDVTVSVVEPRRGMVLDTQEVTDEVRAALLTGRDDKIDLPVEVAEPQADLDAARDVTERARELLAEPFVLTDDTRELTLAPTVLGPVLRAEPDGDGGLRLTTDDAALRDAVAEAAEPLTEPARAPRLRSPYPGTLLTAQGDTSFTSRRIDTSVRRGRPGYRVDVDATGDAVKAAVAEGRRTADLPGEELPVPTATGDLAGVDQVIGSFTTYFPCCAPRAQNIARMAEIVDGAVVAPGETFSLNDTAGERTLDRGFVEDGAIVDGELEMQVGGGVSQFSTTMLNAVWFAGLDRIESQPHSIYISRYPPGREATLDYASIDNVWRNDTDHPVVVRSVATAGSVTVALYGHTGDRTVTSTTSPREEREDGGFRVVVDRTVRDDGEVVSEDSLAWTYNPPLETEEDKKKKKGKKGKKKADQQADDASGSSPSASSSATAGR